MTRGAFAALVPLALAAGCGNSTNGNDPVDLAWAAWPMPNDPADVAAGAPNPMAYTVNGDGTVTDQVTGLMWQQAVSATMYTWRDALTYCSALTLGSHDDWRAPTEIELVSLVDASAAAGAVIDATAFPDTPEGYYWSSLAAADDSANAWLVDFITGSAYDAAVDGPEHVRCVRCASACAAAPAGRYTITAQTVYDTLTKLTWQRSAPTTTYGEDDARAYCTGAALAAALGGTGWRLPTGKELQTLVDFTVPRPGPTIDAAAFPGAPAGFYWSSTATGGAIPGVMLVDFSQGHATNYAVGPTSYVRCVR